MTFKVYSSELTRIKFLNGQTLSPKPFWSVFVKRKRTFKEGFVIKTLSPLGSPGPQAPPLRAGRREPPC